MSMISRKAGESLMINNNIEVIVAGIEDNQVKLKIVAPDEVSIYPKELYAQVKEVTREAVDTVSLETLWELRS